MSKIIMSDVAAQALAENGEAAEQILRLRDTIEAHQRADADLPTRFAVSGSSSWGNNIPARFSSTPGGCGSPPSIPGCFGPDNQRLCDMQRVSVGVIVAGGAVFNLQMEPTQSQWFQPRAVRATVVDAENTTLNSRLLITAITLNDCPLESTNVIAPVAPALVNNTRFFGWWTDDWQDPDTYAVAVTWPTFSDLNGKLPLRIIGIAQGINANSFVAGLFTIYGNAAPPQMPTG